MMVTITSLKKIQEPDLLLDQPRHLRLSNDLNKQPPSPTFSRIGGRLLKKNKNNRRHYPSEESTSSHTSTTTTLTSVSSLSGCDERSPVALGTESDVVIDCLDDENTKWSPNNCEKSQHPSHTSPQVPNRVWIRAKAKTTTTDSNSSKFPCCPTSLSKKQLIVLILTILVLVTSVVSFVAVMLSSHSKMVSSSSGSSDTLSTGDISQIDGDDEATLGNYDYEDSSSEHENRDDSNNSNVDLKEVSRLSWNLLNSNQERVSGKDASSSNSNDNSGTKGRHHHNSHSQNKPIPSSFSGISGGEEVVLPSKMIFSSSSSSDPSNVSHNSSGENKNKKRSCCRTQKYSQVIKRDGCEPLTITNKMCFGQCVSVWVPGLFASFPVCKPSRSSWKMVTLTCGKRKRRVRIEKVRRCSCMEIDPSAPSPNSNKR